MDEKIKVLLIDDEIDFTQPMSFWLESKNYATMSASSGEAALKLMQDYNPDIIFLDLNMPGMDGVQTLRKIREVNNDVPVIFISAYVDDRRIREANPYGVSGVFYKGKDFTEGLSLLESALKTHKKLKK